MAKLTLPSLLSYRGSIKPGAAFYFAELENGSRVPVEVTQATVKGTMASYKEVKGAKNPAEMEKSSGRSNLQTIDQAVLPVSTKKFLMEFVVNVTPGSVKPESCNNQLVALALNAFVARYHALGGFKELAQRYLRNIFNGAWLWRNGSLFETGVIEVKAMIDGAEQTFSAAITPRLDSQLALPAALVELVASALAGDRRVAILRVSAALDAYPGQEVYPSQEFANESTDVSRVFASVRGKDGVRQAFMHPQKVGNALRRIDDWYEPLPGFDVKPLAVEPLGVDASNQVAHRATNGEDFYTLVEKRLDDLQLSLNAAESADQLTPEHHYIVAVLVRGGVFSGEKKSK
ncbi:type I-F CRISPR-associated protein Csy3 [Pseudomonas sp. S1(2024)]|uniref:type I-F CRISPR-associated protein Csy3 n=1 Tax=Pseudomonas sp. S1(2024) TaxID=3390191 RepID=UPI0039788309